MWNYQIKLLKKLLNVKRKLTYKFIHSLLLIIANKNWLVDNKVTLFTTNLS